MPRCAARAASTSSTVASASAAPAQAAATIARSSRRRGAKIPGVSTKISWDCPSIAIPNSRVRVVCTFGVTIASLCPTSWFNSVDLPAFGAPISATKPQRVSLSLSRIAGEGGERSEPGKGDCDESFAGPSPTARFRERSPLSRGAGEEFGSRCSLLLRGIRLAMRRRWDCQALQERCRGGGFGGALRGGGGGRFLEPGNAGCHGEAQRVVGSAGRGQLVVRQWQAAPLRPFLQGGLGIARRPVHLGDQRVPEALDECESRGKPAIEIDRGDYRLAGIREDARIARRPGGHLGG